MMLIHGLSFASAVNVNVDNYPHNYALHGAAPAPFKSPLDVTVNISEMAYKVLAEARIEQYSEHAQLTDIALKELARYQQNEFVQAAQKYSQLPHSMLSIERRTAIDAYTAIQQKVVETSAISATKNGPVAYDNL